MSASSSATRELADVFGARKTPPQSKADAWIGGSMPFARFGLIVNLLVPLGLLIWDAQRHLLGADPVNFAIHTTGFLALTYLLLSLAVTPLRTVSGFAWLIQFRRSLGVYAFYYASIHLAIYFWWQQQGNVSNTVYEIFHRYYLTIGFGCLSLMTPLWATSFDAAIRKLGGKNWKRLHRLAYPAAILGCIHFYLQSKADKREPEIFIGVLAALLVWRWVAIITRRTPEERKLVRAGSAPSAAGSSAKARFWKGEMRVVRIVDETPTVRTFHLALPDGGPLPFSFRAGQFLNLSLEIDGKRVSRSYTIASPPTRDGHVELTIKREDQGHVSRFLHDMLMTGHTVSISAPSGRFSFDPMSSQSLLLIAGGVGITPVMAILRDLTDMNWPGLIDLVFSVRTPADVIFEEELRLLSSRHANLHVHLTVTRESAADWTGPRGRITVELLRQFVPDFAARSTFICGPDEMAGDVRNQLVAAGVPATQISVESFTPAAAVAREKVASALPEALSEAVATAATVSFARSNQTASLSSDQSILEAAESVGVQIDFDCRSGICGQCRCKLLSGQVTMAVRDALSDADEADGYILACQAHASQDVTVDV